MTPLDEIRDAMWLAYSAFAAIEEGDLLKDGVDKKPVVRRQDDLREAVRKLDELRDRAETDWCAICREGGFLLGVTRPNTAKLFVDEEDGEYVQPVLVVPLDGGADE